MECLSHKEQSFYALSYNFANLLRSTTGDITITVGAAGDSHTGFTGQGGGSYYSDNAPSQSNGGAGGLGGNTSIYGYNGTPGANGVDGDFVSWTGSNIYAGGGGGGGGGGAYNVRGHGPDRAATIGSLVERVMPAMCLLGRCGPVGDGCG